MNDYRGELCLLDGQYLARCIGQDFIKMTLTFETDSGLKFTRKGEDGVEIHNDGELGFDDIKHLLPKINPKD